MQSTAQSFPPSQPGPAWEIARLYPDQGEWDEDDYLSLDTNRLVEFTDGHVELLPMPKPAHQRIVLFLFGLLNGFLGGLGEVLVAPVPVRLRKGKFREPDLVLMLAAHASRKKADYWDRPDLVVEVVSPDEGSFERDYIHKRREYAAARIPEYWIVDPQERRITVLRLSGKRYVVHGTFVPGEQATSGLLKGLRIDVHSVLAAAGE